MNSKIVLTSVFILSMAAPQAKALEVGSGAQLGAAGVSVGARTNNDASAGVLVRNDVDTDAAIRARAKAQTQADDDRTQDYERARIYDESDARFRAGGGSNINADTSAGGDENADLRASMRHREEANVSERTYASARVNADANADTGLFGISTSNRTRIRGGLND